jgi:uncharacterized protein YqhQ
MKQGLPIYGGQAVIEGVMMRGAKAVAIAMRAPDQEITIHEEALGGIYTSRIIKIPFLRGLVVLWDALGLGMRALTISANLQMGDEEQLEGFGYYLTMAISLAFGIGLFILTPASASHLGEQYLGWNAWIGNLVEGLVRLLILVGYIWLVGRIPDIKRVFAYHGAEHKVINAFEAGDELTPATVARHSLEHPRCGTAFLLTVVVFSVLIFSLLGPMPLFWRLVARLALLPVIAALAYEYIRWTASHLDSPLVRFIVKPNLALQHLTTREPSLDMLEVSIAAFQTMRTAEGFEIREAVT